MIPPSTYVALVKVAQQNAGPLPTSYWLRGTLAAPLAVGSPIVVMRTERCGREEGEPEVVQCLGEFTSSSVVELFERTDGGVLCRTLNSHWLVTTLPREDT